MNCECFYVIKENTVEAANDFANKIEKFAHERWEELYPVAISEAIKDFSATSDYDNWKTPFKVKSGSILVFVYGKDYSMHRVKIKGGKRGFPNRYFNDDFYENFNDYIRDIKTI